MKPFFFIFCQKNWPFLDSLLSTKISEWRYLLTYSSQLPPASQKKEEGHDDSQWRGGKKRRSFVLERYAIEIESGVFHGRND